MFLSPQQELPELENSGKTANKSSKQILITLNEFDVRHEYYYTTFARKERTLTDSEWNPL